MADINNYRDKVIVITGASSGFGEGAALEFAERGASVVLAARSEERLDDLAKRCEAAGGKALAIVTDVSRRDQVENLDREASGWFGRYHVWVNNAGVGAVGLFDETPLADHEQVIATNLLGATYGSYCALRHFRRHGEGVIINVASSIGKIPAPYYASYVASKFGVVGLSDAIRQELRHENVDSIRVCTVMPMAHDTSFFEHAGNYSGHEAKPIPPTYDPKVTIDELVRLAIDPEDEVITGWQGKVFNFLHQLMPNAIEKMMEKNTAKTVETAPPAPKSSGTVHRPPTAGKR